MLRRLSLTPEKKQEVKHKTRGKDIMKSKVKTMNDFKKNVKLFVIIRFGAIVIKKKKKTSARMHESVLAMHLIVCPDL